MSSLTRDINGLKLSGILALALLSQILPGFQFQIFKIKISLLTRNLNTRFARASKALAPAQSDITTFHNSP